MNKKIFWTLLLSLTLTACSFNFGTVGFAAGGAPSATELPTQTKLILGIVKLDETENAVTAEQAKELLPMFHVLQGLNESDTAAQEEIDGLTNQIQETLTDAQAQAIDGMSLSMRDMFSIAQSEGNSGNTNSSGTTSTSGGGGMDGPPDMGGMPGGGFPGGGGTTTSSSDDQTSKSAMTGTPTALFDAVIKLLEKKLQ